MQLSFILSAMLSLVAISAAAVPEKRATAETPLSLVTALYNNVQLSTGSINSTVSHLSPSSTAAELSKAKTVISSDLTSISSSLNTTVKKLVALGLGKRKIESRQLSGIVGLDGELLILLEEIVATYRNIAGSLGLGPVISPFSGLILSLADLLAQLIPVVDDTEAVTKEIVDGVLLGIANGLDGITL